MSATLKAGRLEPCLNSEVRPGGGFFSLYSGAWLAHSDRWAAEGNASLFRAGAFAGGRDVTNGFRRIAK